MNTSVKFLIPTIFLALGFILSCNDEVTSVGKEESDVKNTTTVEKTPSIPDPPPTLASSSPETPPTDPPKNPTPSSTETPSNEDDPSDMNIDPDDLSRKIKEIGEKIQKLEKESEKHYDEYYQMVEVQKEILNEVKRRKMIMRSKTVGSPEQIEAQKNFEDQKKLGKEKLQILKEKNILLNNLNKSITEAKNEKMDLQKKQEDFLKKQKGRAKKN
ncbi:hypothetical protein [Blattabacterium cuenoti]|uniref:hypothetical protein n=1 Tax=Blattabacterium cuenoti TaxID=1653831 RepID=UPI00163C7E1F|nr:hypothetical protein [Blattabacterium cuenoti]